MRITYSQRRYLAPAKGEGRSAVCPHEKGGCLCTNLWKIANQRRIVVLRPLLTQSRIAFGGRDVRGQSFAPPAFRERRRRCLARLGMAVRREAVLVMPERQRPKPR
jgi:hypothetical protein